MNIPSMTPFNIFSPEYLPVYAFPVSFSSQAICFTLRRTIAIKTKSEKE